MERLSGPVHGGAHGWAFGASLRDLAQVGYVESEFFLTGEAAQYTRSEPAGYSFDGRWAAEPGKLSPFRTRLLVRRPADPAHFNGTLVLNWNNVSTGHENLAGMSAELVESGFAWVGASVQKAGLHGFPFGEPLGLVTWDRERYGHLSIPDDDLSYDIFTQIPEVARALVNLLPFGSHILRTDLDCPLLVLNSKTEAPWYQAVRQPDSNSYRLWEVAGTAHASSGAAEAALRHMQRWMSGAPLHRPRPASSSRGIPL